MVSLTSLWLPILLSAVAVFFASFLVHMVLKYHRADISSLPNEAAVLDALAAVPPGDYVAPYAEGPQAFKDPAYVEKRKRGPTAIITVVPGAPPSMTRELAQWFVYCLVASLFAGYIASRAVGAGADGSEVMRFAGTTAFLGYGLALAQNSIWWKRKWSATIKSLFDSLLYALVTGAVFAWMWP